jgi:hypothetical protein
MVSGIILGNGRSQRTCLFSQGNPHLHGCVERLDREIMRIRLDEV